MNAFYDFFYFLIRPSFWLMNYPYDRHWDSLLNKLINDQEPVSRIGEHTANIGNRCVWISNYPYAYGTPFPRVNARPRRRTILRLRDYVSSQEFSQ